MNTSTTFFCFVKPMFFWKSLPNLAGSRKSPRVPNIGWGICDSSETNYCENCSNFIQNMLTTLQYN